MLPTPVSRSFGQIGVVAFSLSAEGHCSRVWQEHILGEQAGAHFSNQVGEESGLVSSTVSSGEMWQDRVVIRAERATSASHGAWLRTSSSWFGQRAGH